MLESTVSAISTRLSSLDLAKILNGFVILIDSNGTVVKLPLLGWVKIGTLDILKWFECRYGI